MSLVAQLGSRFCSLRSMLNKTGLTVDKGLEFGRSKKNSLTPLGVARIFFFWGGANHKSHAMMSSESFERGTFRGAKLL